MNLLKPLLLLLLIIGNDVFANDCSNLGESPNQLIAKAYDLSDSSPFFIKNELSSFKPGQYDIDINEYFVNPYGNKLGITGNSWKKVKLNNFFIVKENSYLEFDFLSNGDEAEINGVGLMLYGSSGFHSDRFFQVFGTHVSFNQDYHNYPGSQWVTYRIPLWQYFQNTSNKVIEQLIFAGDDDQQVNQSVYYKNVRLIENYSEYSLPLAFEHAPVIIQPTANKRFFHHIYPQTIIGPDNNVYPVSGGSIVKKVYSPPNSNIQETVYVKENYYANLCWDQGINFDSNTLAINSMNNLQTIANTPGAEIPSFNTRPWVVGISGTEPLVLTQNNIMYFDPDVKINGETKSRFINKSRIFSNHSLGYFFEEREAGQNTDLKSGFAFNSVDCSSPGTGKNTKGSCFDLTGLTSYSSGSNKYLSDSNLTTVEEDLRTSHDSPSSSVIVSDLDNKWSENALKQQTTELLINTKHFNNYLNELINGSTIKSLTGNKPQSLINSVPTSNAAYNILTKKVYFAPPGKLWVRSPMTYSRDVGVVAHEFTHAIAYKIFGGQLNEGNMEGCAINEGFSDILGYGAKLFANNVYKPGFAVDAFDNNDRPNGMRNAANPLLTDNDSVFIGSPSQTVSCNENNPPRCPPTRPDCNFDFNQASGHIQATIISHLYHLMVTGGFNADSNFRPEPFGVAPDETFSHIAAERLFFDAMQMGHGSSNIQGTDFTFCNLRNNMIQAAGNDSDKVKVNQAWKQVYKNLETDCPLPVGTNLLKPIIEVISLDNNSILGDGGNLSFGVVNAGFIKTIDLQINNKGDYKLRLINPSIDSSDFSQFGLSSQPMTINVGESSTIQVKFNASNNNTGLNQGTLTFQTNHPDYELYTINLTGTSTSGTQGSPDAYEEDDSFAQASTLEWSQSNSGNNIFQSRNFNDDNQDYIKINLPGSQNNQSCNLTISNMGENINACISKYMKDGNLINTTCDYNNNSSNNQINYIHCDQNNNCEDVDLKISNQNTFISNTNYTLSLVCIQL